MSALKLPSLAARLDDSLDRVTNFVTSTVGRNRFDQEFGPPDYRIERRANFVIDVSKKR
jgi:hypothetical protein